MSDRTLKTMILILGVVVVLYAVSLLVVRGGDDRADLAPTGALADLFADVAPDQVAAVEFSGPTLEAPLRLERARAAWTAGGHVADSALVDRFLQAFDEADLGELASRNPANHARMGVSADSAVVMVVERETSTDTVLIGSAGPRYNTAYVRAPGDDRVYLMNGEIRSPATRPLDQWRTKRILTVDTAAVARVALTRDGDTFQLVRSDSAWTVDGAPADSSRVRQVMGELAILQAQGFSDLATPPEDAPARRVLATDTTGAVVADIRLWDPAEESGTSATLAAEGALVEPGVIYTFPTWRMDRLAPSRDEMTAAGGDGG